MTEINKNIPHIIPNLTNSANKKTEVQTSQSQYNNDIKEIPSEMGILGKSQVSKPDNIQSDIEFCLTHSEEFLNKCDKFFDKSFENLSKAGDEFAYEKACLLSKEFANEFV